MGISCGGDKYADLIKKNFLCKKQRAVRGQILSVPSEGREHTGKKATLQRPLIYLRDE